MNIKIKKSKLSGNLTAPPSKSYAHRYLLAAALSNDECTISNIDFSDDIIATLNCIHAYGKKHYRDFENHKVVFSKEYVKNYDPTFDCKESGTTLRVFLPIALQKYDKASFIGSDRLIERGVKVYKDLFKYITFDESKYIIKTKGLLSASIFNLPGNISSQYISGLLFAAPLLKDDSTINITTELESKNYVTMTLQVLSQFGIKAYCYGETSPNAQTLHSLDDSTKFIPQELKQIIVPGNQKYHSSNFSVEGDYSNAAFIDAFNYFDNDIKITGLNPNSLQSDSIYKTLFDKLNDGFCEIDISNCIDLGPILITFATLKHGAKFLNTSRLKIKESNRGEAIATELRKCNASIEILDNEIIVNKAELSPPSEAFNSHNDHRIAMSLSLLSTLFDIEICDYECVKKSYPTYFDELKKLGAEIN